MKKELSKEYTVNSGGVLVMDSPGIVEDVDQFEIFGVVQIVDIIGGLPKYDLGLAPTMSEASRAMETAGKLKTMVLGRVCRVIEE